MRFMSSRSASKLVNKCQLLHGLLRDGTASFMNYTNVYVHVSRRYGTWTFRDGRHYSHFRKTSFRNDGLCWSGICDLSCSCQQFVEAASFGLFCPNPLSPPMAMMLLRWTPKTL